MKQKVMISAGNQAFEFEGEITTFNDDYIIIDAKHGEIFIERKYLVFIQFLNEDNELVRENNVKPIEPQPLVVKKQKPDEMVKLINKRLKHDPLELKLEEKLVPPSQFPDYIVDEVEKVVSSEYIDEDMEAAKNIMGYAHGVDHPVVKATSLKQAVKNAMNNDDEDFVMGSGSIEFKTPLQTVLEMKNANTKKNRSS